MQAIYRIIEEQYEAMVQSYVKDKARSKLETPIKNIGEVYAKHLRNITGKLGDQYRGGDLLPSTTVKEEARACFATLLSELKSHLEVNKPAYDITIGVTESLRIENVLPTTEEFEVYLNSGAPLSLFTTSCPIKVFVVALILQMLAIKAQEGITPCDEIGVRFLYDYINSSSLSITAFREAFNAIDKSIKIRELVPRQFSPGGYGQQDFLMPMSWDKIAKRHAYMIQDSCRTKNLKSLKIQVCKAAFAPYLQRLLQRLDNGYLARYQDARGRLNAAESEKQEIIKNMQQLDPLIFKIAMRRRFVDLVKKREEKSTSEREKQAIQAELNMLILQMSTEYTLYKAVPGLIIDEIYRLNVFLQNKGKVNTFTPHENELMASLETLKARKKALDDRLVEVEVVWHKTNEQMLDLFKMLPDEIKDILHFMRQAENYCLDADLIAKVYSLFNQEEQQAVCKDIAVITHEKLEHSSATMPQNVTAGTGLAAVASTSVSVIRQQLAAAGTGLLATPLLAAVPDPMPVEESETAVLLHKASADTAAAGPGSHNSMGVVEDKPGLQRFGSIASAFSWVGHRDTATDTLRKPLHSNP